MTCATAESTPRNTARRRPHTATRCLDGRPATRLARAKRKLAQPLRPAHVGAGVRVRQHRRAAEAGTEVTGHHRKGGRVAPRAEERPPDEVREAVAHVASGVALVEPALPAAVAAAFRPQVPERQVEERADLPTSQLRLDRVDLVPALALLERQHLAQALAPVRTRGAPDVGARAEAWTPLAVDLLVAEAAGDAERRVRGEGVDETLEVVVLEVEVGAELDDDLRQLRPELDQAGLERAHDRAAAGGSRGLQRDRADPGVLPGQPGGHVTRRVGRARVNDRPGRGQPRLARDPSRET